MSTHAQIDAHSSADRPERPVPDGPSDGQLLAAARRGETEAFGVLFARYRDIAVKVARRAGVRPTDVDDVVADAWSRVLRAIEGGNGPTENFPGYLATAIRRVAWAYNEHRAMYIPTEEAGVLDGVWADEPYESLADTELGRAMARLPASWREVLWRVEVEGEKVASIAAECRKSANAVSAIASRARKRLRAELSEVAEVTELAGQHLRESMAPALPVELTA
ncbi:RNA polymerase sigma factor [Nocardioides sp. R1-1]|uniref:RNA polymerase sigma factor n=1 Tax=Nocardioides sp. R1-1 TaxID=3383502 RepID=UPI0038D106E4